MQLQNQSNLIFHISSTLSNRVLRQLARKYHIKYTTKKKTIPQLQAIADELTLLEKRARIDANDECSICFDPLQMETVAITRCKHAFCNKCIFKYVFSHSKTCPMCRAEYNATMLMNDKMYFPTEYVPILYGQLVIHDINDDAYARGHARGHEHLLFLIIKLCYCLIIFYFYYQCWIISSNIFMMFMWK